MSGRVLHATLRRPVAIRIMNMTTFQDSFISFDELAGLSSADTLVVTVNNRHARRLVSDFAGYLDQNRRAMPLPDIVPFAAWLHRLGDRMAFQPGAVPPPHSLDAFGARCVWEQAIAQVESGHVLLDVAQAARHAMDADRLVSDWFLQVSPHEETHESRRFHLWRDRYRAMLARLDAEDANLEYDRVCAALADGTLPCLFQTMVLAGFNAFSPRQAGLIESVRERGVRVARLRAGPDAAGSIQHVAADDPDTEWRMAAQWAAEQLRRNPQGHYAIVAAHLETDAAYAHRVLRDALREPEDAVPRGAGCADAPMDPVHAAFLRVAPYNVAVARPLSEWPHVRAALAWLRLMLAFSLSRECTPELAGAALLAGACAGDAAEAPARAAMDAAWRRKYVPGLSCQAFLGLLSDRAPRLHAAWLAWIERRGDGAEDASMAVWADRFRRWLQCLGFPGEESLDSHGHQVVEAFDDMLSRLARQAPVLGRVGGDAAIGMLARLARETLFQPQRDPLSRLDVLGFLESEGGRWDGVWVLGLTDEVLPAAPSPNPLVPLAVLRRAQAPRATPEREFEWARTMYDAFVASAPQVWLSCPRQEGERELRPSPFLEPFQDGDFEFERRKARAYRLEQWRDDRGPELRPGQASTGGIGVIDTQARNPLWAFVKYRLGARALEGYPGVYDQNARGMFLHKAVELVWRMLKSQEDLHAAFTEGRLDALIEQAVGQARDAYLKHYSPALADMEARRGADVLRSWLEFEMSRPPFEVAGLEEECQWSFGPLVLTLRIDRVDTLAQGRLAILDYKSGMGAIDPKSNWMRERPVGLQLPFYAAAVAPGPDSVGALVLARLHARKIETRGLAADDCDIPGLAHLGDWPLFANYRWTQLMERWRGVIEKLAGDYARGVADNVSTRASDLEYCDVLPFLRLNQEPPSERETAI